MKSAVSKLYSPKIYISGQCVGIVVGQRVPRYSVLGDAMDVTDKLLKHGSGE